MAITNNNNNNNSASVTVEVQLAVYDLSHGMARQMSTQFLGEQLDIIPHTALVVFGREYFFGGGIQHEDPTHFRHRHNMHPVQTVPLGSTSVPRDQFEAWCSRCTQSGRYTAASYDLLERNCNHFSHDAALEGLGLPQGVPSWILEVPGKFLSSPMGQMVRPMLQNMQLTGGSNGSSGGNGGGGGGMGMGMAAPFASAPTTGSFGGSGGKRSAPSPSTPIENPWANLSASSSKPAADANVTPMETEPKGTPILDSYCKPLLSNDSKTIPLCVKKLVDNLDEPADKEVLEQIATSMTAQTESLSSHQVEQACNIVLSILQNASTTANASPTTFALMFLRVLILQPTTTSSSSPSEAPSSARSCLEWICTELLSTSASRNGSGGVLTNNHAARSMAWLTLANATAVALPWWQVPESILEATLGDLSRILQPRPEVRQAAAALCYNHVVVVVVTSTKQKKQEDDGDGDDDDDGGMSDNIVSLLCSSLDGIDTEPDATTRLRRVLVAARILQPVIAAAATPGSKVNSNSPAAKLLMQQLGFDDMLQLIVSGAGAKTTGNVKDGETCRSVAKEVLGLLQS